MIGRILTLAGAILLAILGVIHLTGYVPEGWLTGLTNLLLGVGLVLYLLPASQRLDQLERQLVSSRRREDQRDQRDARERKEP